MMPQEVRGLWNWLIYFLFLDVYLYFSAVSLSFSWILVTALLEIVPVTFLLSGGASNPFCRKSPPRCSQKFSFPPPALQRAAIKLLIFTQNHTNLGLQGHRALKYSKLEDFSGRNQSQHLLFFLQNVMRPVIPVWGKKKDNKIPKQPFLLSKAGGIKLNFGVIKLLDQV